MKRTIILLALLLPFLVKAQGGAYTVHGKTDLPADGMIKLLWYNINSGRHTDSTFINNGHFEFKGTMKQIEIGQLLFESGGSTKSVVFYLEPGNINIDLPAGAMYAKLSGTPLNNDFEQYYEMMNTLLTRVNADRKGQRLYDQFSKEIMEEKLEVIKKLVKEHPGSRVSVDQMNAYAIKNSNAAALTPLYNQLSPAMQKSADGLQLASRIKGMQSGKIGDMAPAFSLPDTSGHVVNLSDFRGKYVLLDFWATWCGPCLEEMPNVMNARDKYKDKNFTVVGVSLDRPDSKAKWLDMIKQSKYNWTQLSDLSFWNSKPALLYNVNSVPANFLIDPQGKIIGKNLRGEALQKKLAELL
jgi:peroxiredoxin